jgi:hypothetical protein
MLWNSNPWLLPITLGGNRSNETPNNDCWDVVKLFESTHLPIALSSVDIQSFLSSFGRMESNPFWMQFAAESSAKIKLTKTTL